MLQEVKYLDQHHSIGNGGLKNESLPYLPTILFHYTIWPSYSKDWFLIVKILNVLWESLKRKWSWLTFQCSNRFSKLKVIVSHTSFDIDNVFEGSQEMPTTFQLWVQGQQGRLSRQLQATSSPRSSCQERTRLTQFIISGLILPLDWEQPPFPYSLPPVCCFLCSSSPSTSNHPLSCCQRS